MEEEKMKKLSIKRTSRAILAFATLIAVLGCNTMPVFASSTNNEFVSPSSNEISETARTFGVSEEEAKIYLWGIENQKRESKGLPPVAMPGKQTLRAANPMKDFSDDELAAQKDKVAAQLYEAELAKDNAAYNSIIQQNPNLFENRSNQQNTNASISPFSVLGNNSAVYTPFYKQQNLYYCGVASTQMALAARNCYKTPWGSTVTQSLLANNNYLETDAYGYTVGRYISYTLNTILQTDFYIYKSVDSNDAKELIRRVRLDHTLEYVPIVAVYQPPYSSTRLKGYPFDGYELRHFIPIHYMNGVDPATATIGYTDPVSGWGGRYANVPQRAGIPAKDMSWLVSGGSITY